MRSLRILSTMLMALLLASFAAGADTGTLKLDVMGELGAGARNPAHVFASGGKEAGQVMPGGTIALAPGTYQLVMPIIGGKITKNDVEIEAGRTHTVLITNVALLEVDVKARNSKDPGFGVTVTDSTEGHAKVASFLSGDKYLFAPMEVNVHVDAPPQGYDWHAVPLVPGRRTLLSLKETAPAELVVQTVMSKMPIDGATRVIILRAGTQSQVAASDPGPEHRIKLDPGDYDIFVENRAGKGKPYVTSQGVHLESGATVERTVPMD